MKHNKKAFTLIELLVVVLIIGILAAIALPMYHKAVAKSQATQALTMLKSLEQAYKAYYMANGKWASSLDDLDINIPWTGNTPWNPSYSARSTDDWSAQISIWGNPTTAVIYIGRLTGPYAGTGLAYFFSAWGTVGSLYIPANTLVCVERPHNSVSSGAVFQKDDGDFCKKVMGSKQVVQAGSGGLYYDMP